MYRPKGYSFAPFRSSGFGFPGKYGSLLTYRSFQFQQMKLERKRICNGFKKYFCWRSNLSNDDIISARGLRTGWILEGQV